MSASLASCLQVLVAPICLVLYFGVFIWWMRHPVKRRPDARTIPFQIPEDETVGDDPIIFLDDLNQRS